MAARPKYVQLPAPKVVSTGSVSRPKAPPKWRPRPVPGDTPRIVQA